MFHIDNHSRTMRNALPGRSQSGFSLMEVLIATTVMLVVVAAVFSLMKDSMKVAMVTYELTDAQQNLRTAHEFINRDIMNAGDGLKGFGDIRIPQLFYTNYITLVPGSACNLALICNLAIFTTDNVVPVNTTITGSVPPAKILAGTDRQTILEIDPEFNGGQPITLRRAHTECTPAVAVAAAIDAPGSIIRIPGDPCATGTPGPAMSMFTVGEIYFFSASAGGVFSGTFGVITAINTAGRTLTFATGDTPYGLNRTGAGGHIQYISTSGTVDTTLQRMKIIQYYVNENKLLMRRVFGIQGVGARESIIAEHVLDVQFTYALLVTDALGVVTPSTSVTLSTPAERVAVRQVDVRVRVETPHATRNGNRQPLEMTTSTSVRNMQFRQAN